MKSKKFDNFGYDNDILMLPTIKRDFSNQKLKQWSKPFYAVICSFCLEFKYKSLIDERKSVLSVTLIALNLLVGKKSRKKINKKNMLCCLTFYIIKPRVLSYVCGR